MDVLKNKSNCCGCHACYNACPIQAISMKTDEEGFLYPVIDEEKCIHCNKCRRVCPVLNVPENNPLEEVYACYASDHTEQVSSSSGGVYAVLARAILNKGGLICGAAYDDRMQVEHILIASDDKLSKIKGTKYVQSTIGNTYIKMKEALNGGKNVLFSGTPCQVAGLKSYLGKEYDNLLCVDLVCHGVPSPEVWSEYLQEVGHGQKACYVNFREKQGDGNTSLVYKFENGLTVREKKEESLYMKGFLQNLFLRPSCFECKFKGSKRCSDMTIGDFWSIKEYHPDFASSDGNSALIIHSEKAKVWLDQILPLLNIKRATIEEVILWNECLVSSVKTTPNRKEFYDNWKKKPLTELIPELIQQPKESIHDASFWQFLAKVTRKVKKLLG